MKQSRLHDRHTTLGAQMRESSGWTVPAHYGDVAAEHAAVRQQVGIADLSHRGTLRVTGEDRVKWLQSVISNDILPLQPGHGRYSSFLTHKGKMLTYFRVYQQPDSVVIEDVGPRSRPRSYDRHGAGRLRHPLPKPAVQPQIPA